MTSAQRTDYGHMVTKHQAIIVRFNDNEIKSSMKKASTQEMLLTAKKLNFKSNDRIYIGDHLSKQSSLMIKKAKSLKAEEKFTQLGRSTDKFTDGKQRQIKLLELMKKNSSNTSWRLSILLQQQGRVAQLKNKIPH